MYSFQFIMIHKLDKNEDFWNFLVPLVKKQMTTLDRNTIRSLFDAINGASQGFLQDNEFWEIVEQKLVDEGLHRYLKLEQLVDIIVALGRVGRGSDDLVEVIEKTLIKHRKGLTDKTIAQAKIGFASVNKGSEILHRVLEDPSTELPALE